MNKKKDVRDKKRKNERLNKALAISQICSLILEIFAVSFILGGMIVLSSERMDALTQEDINNAKVGDYFKLGDDTYIKVEGGWKFRGIIYENMTGWFNFNSRRIQEVQLIKASQAAGGAAGGGAGTTAQTGAAPAAIPAPTARSPPILTPSPGVYRTSFWSGKPEFTDISSSGLVKMDQTALRELNLKLSKEGITTPTLANGNIIEVYSSPRGAIGGYIYDPSEGKGKGLELSSSHPGDINKLKLLQDSGVFDFKGYVQDSFFKNFYGSEKTFEDFKAGDNFFGGWRVQQVDNIGTEKRITLINDIDGSTRTLQGKPNEKIAGEVNKQWSEYSAKAAAGGGTTAQTGGGAAAGRAAQISFWKDYFFTGLQYAGMVLGITQLLGTFIGGEKGKNIQMMGWALAAGIQTGYTITGIIEKAGGKFLGIEAGWWGFGAGLLVAYLIAANNIKETKEREVNVEFKCMPWQAPRGGANCEKCNENPLQPCSEYRCRALGQTCKLINQGTGFERCIDSAPNDVTSPGIKPWKNVLTPGYKYIDVKERPPGGKGPSGMRIVSEEGGCLKAFTPFEFGIITTDIGNVPQPAQCKIDFNHTEKFDDMNYYMDDNNLFVENHSQRVSLPNTDTLNKTFPEIKNDGEYSLYIRCKDGNGNENRDEFVVSFCIDKTPDVTAPIIKTTSIPSGSPVLYNVDNVSLAIYTNEPANCRWSRNDASYSNMENQMSCSNNVWEMNAELLYTCTTTLTGIKNKEENKFYFRCQDLSPQNNTMSQSYPFTLIGTQPLNIIKVSPNGTIGSSTTVATVELGVWTDNGFRNGEATCYFSKTQNEKDYIAMSETGGNIHKQSLDLTEGNYVYYFKCVDLGGNTAYNSTNFSIFVDRYSPTIVRTYKYEDKLIIITDEESKCRYSTESCNFDLSKDEGISMPYDFDASKTHYAEWKADQVYYIKCLDKYNNQPEPTECSLIARPFNMPE